jgi:hypothetical protein
MLDGITRVTNEKYVRLVVDLNVWELMQYNPERKIMELRKANG